EQQFPAPRKIAEQGIGDQRDADQHGARSQRGTQVGEGDRAADEQYQPECDGHGTSPLSQLWWRMYRGARSTAKGAGVVASSSARIRQAPGAGKLNERS